MNHIEPLEPLQRDGNSQPDRDNRYRNPEEMKVDARNVLDILHFFWQYAKVVRYYDVAEGEKGDWSAFFSESVPFQLAKIAQFDAEKWWETFQTHRENVINKAHLGGVNQLCEFLFDAFLEWQQWENGLNGDKTATSLVITNLNQTNVKPLLETFIPILNVVESKFGLKINRDKTVFLHGFLNDDESILRRKDEIINQKRGNLQTLLPDLISFDGENKGKLERIAELLYKAFLEMNKSFLGEKEDDDFVANDYKHAPHLGLMFAFLRLFKEAQGEMNHLSARHLDYFYKEILLFKTNAAIPDKAHLVFELAKQMKAGQLLKTGTQYKDGKDNNKAEVIFGLEEEIVVNKAKVAAAHTIHYPNHDFSYSNTLDFSDPNKSWKTFGRVVVQPKKLLTFPYCDIIETIEKEEKRNTLAFVIASKALEARDEATKVEVVFTLDSNWMNTNNKHLKIYYSGKEGWQEIGFDSTDNSSTAVFTINNIVAMLPMNSAILKKEGFKGTFAKLSALKFELKGEDEDFESFVTSFRALKIQDIALNVSAVLNKSLTIFNDEGNIDVTKKFTPFGASANSVLSFGAEEWVGKKIKTLKLVSKLESEPKRFHFFNKEVINPIILDIDYAKTGNKAYSNSIEVEIDKPFTFPNKERKETFVNIKLHQNYFISIAEYNTLLNIQKQGFVDINSKINDVYYQSLANENDIKLGAEINLPANVQLSVLYKVAVLTLYTPTLKDFELSYVATEDTDIHFIHLYPIEQTYDVVEDIANSSFLPELAPIKGALFVGLKEVQAETNISLLFQFLPYSGNPDVVWGDITWSLLQQGNQWKKLTQGVDYEDDTQDFKQSGIIKFKVSKSDFEKTIEPIQGNITVMSSELFWLRASVTVFPEAFDKLLNIKAQAAKAVFLPSLQNDLERLNLPLGAEKIKKPIVENVGIAKVMQPYPSFDGFATEKSPAFYRRVSEQLRHKGRAITIWDYEMLTLENFSLVYKAKAISHYYTKIVGKNEAKIARDECYSNCDNTGNRANYVTLVLVPDVQLLPEEKEVRERPKVNRNTLDDIGDFFQNRISPFASLEVINPEYVGVFVDFKVQFKAGKDEGFYKKLLQEEIRLFLAPWQNGASDLIHFGGSLHYSSILYFVEQRDYVDYVLDFKMYDDNGFLQKIIVAKTPYQVITNTLCEHTIGTVKCP